MLQYNWVIDNVIDYHSLALTPTVYMYLLPIFSNTIVADSITPGYICICPIYQHGNESHQHGTILLDNHLHLSLSN